MMRLAIIGAGMAGLACADRLRAEGIAIRLFDKARGPGGRMSTRRIETPVGTASFDHGAQYFTARDPMFRDRVNSWAVMGLVAPWPEAGADAWVGTPAMNAPVRHMAARHDVRFQHHAHGLLRDGDAWWIRFTEGIEGPFDAVIVALPAEQCAPIVGLHDFRMAAAAAAARSQPCWTAMIAFESRLPIVADHIRDKGMIGWAARNTAKPGRTGPEAWVVQASARWSSKHIEDDAESVAARLGSALARQAGLRRLPPMFSLTAHRWRFAMTRGPNQGALWNPAIRLGACGDWLIGPRVELAWLSGRMLGDTIALDLPFAERPAIAVTAKAHGLRH